MITAIVRFTMPEAMPLESFTELSEGNAPLYKGMKGLVRKYYVRSDDGLQVGGVYLWESREAAEAVYTDEWRERVTGAYGSAPTIDWFDSPVVVDNRHNEIVT